MAWRTASLVVGPVAIFDTRNVVASGMSLTMFLGSFAMYVFFMFGMKAPDQSSWPALMAAFSVVFPLKARNRIVLKCGSPGM